MLHGIDLAIIVAYLALVIAVGWWVSRGAGKDMESYFLGGKKLPWYMLGLSNASGMFDIGGTMWMVSLLFLYGLKSAFIPWLWPVFNQIFLMVFLSAWLRRSGVLTGAEWITFRFGQGRGATLSHLVVVAFALITVFAYLAFYYISVGKFAAIFLPFELSADPQLNAKLLGLVIVALTSLYVVKGGMVSVVVTEVLQFFIMVAAAILIGAVAMSRVSPDTLAAIVPEGWDDIGFGWRLGIDWSDQSAAAQALIGEQGYELFMAFFGLVLFKGVLQSIAGPAPNYDMQRVLAAKDPREASLMSGWVNVVLLFPRYVMITGLTILAIAFFLPQLNAMEGGPDFEQVLPFAIGEFLPVGVAGLVIAGLLAAFMGSFAASTNAAPAYIVNDIIKRYLRPNLSPRDYGRLSILFSGLMIGIGTLFGWFLQDLDGIVNAIAGALYGGYTVANILKWVWWRFNGQGYFWGMVTGIASAYLLGVFDISAVFGFPLVMLACLAVSVGASLATPATPMPVLVEFYRKTRPWGWWGPVLRELREVEPDAGANRDFGRDMFNCAVGIVWQTAITVAAIYFTLRNWDAFAVSAGVVAVATMILKVSWYDRMKVEGRDYDQAASREVTA